jgi:hypothetical protein
MPELLLKPSRCQNVKPQPPSITDLVAYRFLIVPVVRSVARRNRVATPMPPLAFNISHLTGEEELLPHTYDVLDC